jgi:hypothetical protein
MLVYAVRLQLAASEFDAALRAAASWLEYKCRVSVRHASIIDTSERRMSDGSTISVVADATDAPRLYSLRYEHADAHVRGRNWVTEFGLRSDGLGPVLCTVTLRTDEVSSRAALPTQVTRPGIVQHILRGCRTDMATCTGDVKNLPDEAAAVAFHEGINDSRRTYPFVLVSPTPNGRYLVDVARCADLLVGLAEVVQIPPGSNTYAIEHEIGRQVSAFHGAVNVIQPPVTRGATLFTPNVRMLADDLLDLTFTGGSSENEVISTVLHLTNRFHVRLHISPEFVREESLRRELARRREDIKTHGDSADYIALLEEENDKLNVKLALSEEASLAARDALDEAQDEHEDEMRRLRYDLESTRSQLQSSYAEEDASAESSLDDSAFRAAVTALAERTISVEQALKLATVLHPDALVALDTAQRSARDAAGLSGGPELLRLLLKLATDYRLAMRNGGGDNEARKVFGKEEYAATESKTTRNNRVAAEARTFSYRDEVVLMNRHLKYGVKDDSLRVYFHWDGAAARVVIGHCGRHLTLG